MNTWMHAINDWNKSCVKQNKIAVRFDGSTVSLSMPTRAYRISKSVNEVYMSLFPEVTFDYVVMECFNKLVAKFDNV